MSIAPEKLPLTVLTLYAELLDLSEDDDAHGYARGTFVKKVIKGRNYWYHQYTVGGKRIQKYLGSETPKLLQQMSREMRNRRARRGELLRRSEICRALRSALPRTMDQTTVRILKALSEARAFTAGAVLIGTYAFSIYGVMLGRKLKEANARTSDVDFAGIPIAVPDPISFSEIIQDAEKNMLVVPAAPNSRISTKLKLRDLDYRVELLTPGNQDESKPIVIPNLKFGAQPLPFLDFLIERPTDAVLPADVGIRIKVPLPERYALHKLIVAQVRDRGAFAKREKDLAQAEELISILKEDLPKELAAAWKELEARGENYREKALASLDLLKISPQDLIKELKSRAVRT